MLIEELATTKQDKEFLPHAAALAAYRWMALSRQIDKKEFDLKMQGRTNFQISGAGHEAIQVAAAMQLRPGHDWFYPYYRDRALCLVLGVKPQDMALAAFARRDDPSSGGRQMPCHWGDKSLNIVSQSSVTGTQCLQAVGCAEAARIYANIPLDTLGQQRPIGDEVTFVSMGEGATSEGEFWESLNTACNLRLAVVYLIEDNGYAISVPVEVQTAGGSISRLVEGFPWLKVIRVDGTDFFESCVAMRDAIDYARSGLGPAFVHAKVVRLDSHSASDRQTDYRTSGECVADTERDPLVMLRAYLIRNGIATEADLGATASEIQAEVDRAADAAEKAAKPSSETALCWVYSPTVDPTSDQFHAGARPNGEPQTMISAINETLKGEMAHNPRIVVFGQDVADCSKAQLLDELAGQGGVFKATRGLQRTYPDRVFNAPIAEANIIGRAIGMATRGLKPVVEIEYFDYIWPAMLQIRNEMCVMRYRSANSFSCPVVIRVPIGGYVHGSIYHSQSGESIFAHCPGLRVVFPSNAADAAGLLRSSIRCEDPVLFLEHKHLYRKSESRRSLSGDGFMIPFGRAALCMPGEDVIIITWGALVQMALHAAKEARLEGVSVGVLDLRTIVPYDWKSIVASVKATHRVIVAHEDQITCGFGAEIAARIAAELFEFLEAPIIRIGAKDTPVAYSSELETMILPQREDILRAIRMIMNY